MNRLWDDDRIWNELGKVATWCAPGDPEVVALYDAKVIMRRMRDEYEAMLAWQPVANGDKISSFYADPGEGVVCETVVRRWGSGPQPEEKQTRLAMIWIDENGNWREAEMRLDDDYWLCRRVARQEEREER